MGERGRGLLGRPEARSPGDAAYLQLASIQPSKYTERVKTAIRLLLLGLLLGLAGCASYQPVGAVDPAATGVTTRSARHALILEPADGLVRAPGLLFYPGARVRAEAYVELLARVARTGRRVVIVRPPLDFAILAPRRGERVLRELGEAGRGVWVADGHSLGGVVAAAAVRRDPARFVALALLASYPAANGSLADRAVRVLSLYADHDGLAPPEEIRSRDGLLPSDARYVLIRGGNHAGFGSYGPQKGDGVATIPRSEQQETSAAEILRLLESL